MATFVVLAGVVAVAMAGVSCSFSLDSGQALCGPQAECPTEFECRYDGLCYRKGVGLSTTCDDGVVDSGETCDPPGSCPSSCDDGNSCTIDNKVGSARSCDVGCLRTVIEECADDDGCCPDGCSFSNDTDCSATCGNGTVDDKETCDPPEFPCMDSCNDGKACTKDLTTGSAGNCNLQCSFVAITDCVADGCCVVGCTSDPDCSDSCGNDVVEPEKGETCDGDCPTQESCAEGQGACTIVGVTGGAQTCNAECTYQTRGPQNDDGCCPPTGTAANDNDCPPCELDQCCDEANGENYTNCADDCNCGNGTCETWEIEGGAMPCPADCTGGPPPPPVAPMSCTMAGKSR